MTTRLSRLILVALLAIGCGGTIVPPVDTQQTPLAFPASSPAPATTQTAATTSSPAPFPTNTPCDPIAGCPTATHSRTPLPTATPPAATTSCDPALECATKVVSIELTGLSGHRSQHVRFEAILHVTGVEVVGVQNDIAFDPAVLSVGLCSPGPAINKQIGFNLIPSDCADTGTCTTLRVLVFSPINLDPIPDGTLLYFCDVLVQADAPLGRSPLHIERVVAADARGRRLPASGIDGDILVVLPSPTPTPTATATPCDPLLGCPTATPTFVSEVQIEIGTASGIPGEDVEFAVTLHVRNAEILGVQNEIDFAPPLQIAATTRHKPDCRVNPDLHKSLSGFALHSESPPGCMETNTCTAIRAIVAPGLDDGACDLIPDGAELYRCRVAIAADATAGSYPLTIDGVRAADPEGHVVPANGISGAIIVEPRP
jgi:hypothetical protein